MAEGKREAALEMLKSNELAKSSAAIAFNIGNINFELGELESTDQRWLHRDHQGEPTPQALAELFPNHSGAHRRILDCGAHDES